MMSNSRGCNFEEFPFLLQKMKKTSKQSAGALTALYNARSTIAHGASSQASDEHWTALRQSQKVIMNLILGATEVYGLLRFGRQGRSNSLQSFF
jgi:hypothetical protein